MSAAVPQLASTLVSAQGYDINIAAFVDDDESVRKPENPGVTVSRWPLSRREWLPGKKRTDEFRDMLRAADGIHIHGLWESSTFIGSRSARLLKTPYIVSAHGMLESWALNYKRLKKQLYAALIERANLDGASCVHALTQAEAQDYKKFGVKTPVAIIPNGISAPASVSRTLFFEQYPQLEGQRIALFLGRIHQKKGIDILIEAWAALARRFSDTTLVLAGPATSDSLLTMSNLLIQHGVSERTFYTGMLEGELKWSALACSDVFILPSYSEGLSVATLEAMAMGIPVIVSEQCHIPEVETYDAGLVISADARALTCAIDDILSNSPATNAEIGANGRRLVRSRYCWPVVAQQMADLYRWVTGGDTPQSFEWIRVKA
ncbi:glycosyltransferase [Silvibacterium sp.]|uniref:glycosyltransferase n=1 Tax=Silvibacterium sp. TaxID=1964179 RepID=UPI0039E32F75